MRKYDDLNLHGVPSLPVRVLGLADVLAGVRRDGLVDAILAAHDVGSGLVEDPTDLRLGDAVGVAEEGQAVTVEDNLLGRTFAGDHRRVDNHAKRDSVVGGVHHCKQNKNKELKETQFCIL